MSLMRHVWILSAAATVALGSASAQFAASPSSSSPAVSPATESSSSSLQLATDDGAAGLEALPSAPASGAGQNGGGYKSHSLFSHLTFAAGGGFNAPTTNSSPYITWGGNFNVAGGYRFSPYLSLMTEYQFIDDKLPGAIIAEAGSSGGHAHIWSFTMAPVVDLFPKSTNSIYVTGGGGFYRKVTSFTVLEASEYCDFYYCGIEYSPAVVGHFSSNQGGWNIGAGYTHRVGGSYSDSKMKLFAEARYLDVLTPAITTEPNGLGTTSVAADTKLVPVTFGIRW
jgi:hypothetical protein